MNLLKVKNGSAGELLVGSLAVGRYSGVLTVCDNRIEIYLLSKMVKVTGRSKINGTFRACRQFTSRKDAEAYAAKMPASYNRLSQIFSKGFKRF